MSALNTYHVRKFIITKIWNVTCFLLPWIPDDCVREIVLLHSHFPTGNDICDDMLWLRVLIDSVSPFTYCNYVTTFLEDLVVSSLYIKPKHLDRILYCLWLKCIYRYIHTYILICYISIKAFAYMYVCLPFGKNRTLNFQW